MTPVPSRRRFLQSTATAGAALGLGEWGGLLGFSVQRDGDATVAPDLIGYDPEIAALARLIECGTVQGIKDSTGKEERLRELMAVGRDELPVYGASDSFALRARELGAAGFISALANIYPATFERIWAGDRDAQAAIDRVRSAVKGYGGIGGLKTLLRLRGLDFGRTRLPFADLDPGQERELTGVVDELGDLT